jgi:hypothetical protein
MAEAAPSIAAALFLDERYSVARVCAAIFHASTARGPET